MTMKKSFQVLLASTCFLSGISSYAIPNTKSCFPFGTFSRSQRVQDDFILSRYSPQRRGEEDVITRRPLRIPPRPPTVQVSASTERAASPTRCKFRHNYNRNRRSDFVLQRPQAKDQLGPNFRQKAYHRESPLPSVEAGGSAELLVPHLQDSFGDPEQVRELLANTKEIERFCNDKRRWQSFEARTHDVLCLFSSREPLLLIYEFPLYLQQKPVQNSKVGRAENTTYFLRRLSGLTMSLQSHERIALDLEDNSGETSSSSVICSRDIFEIATRIGNPQVEIFLLECARVLELHSVIVTVFHAEIVYYTQLMANLLSKHPGRRMFKVSSKRDSFKKQFNEFLQMIAERIKKRPRNPKDTFEALSLMLEEFLVSLSHSTGKELRSVKEFMVEDKEFSATTLGFALRRSGLYSDCMCGLEARKALVRRLILRMFLSSENNRYENRRWGERDWR